MKTFAKILAVACLIGIALGNYEYPKPSHGSGNGPAHHHHHHHYGHHNHGHGSPHSGGNGNGNGDSDDDCDGCDGPMNGGSANAGGRLYHDGDLELNGCAQLGYAGTLFNPPSEFIRKDGVADGYSIRMARLLEDKGYLAKCGCPYDCFDEVRDPEFSNTWTAAGPTLTTWGENMQNGASNVDVVPGWGYTVRRQQTLCGTRPVSRSGEYVLICDKTDAGPDGCPDPETLGPNDDPIDVLIPAGFENDAICLREVVTNFVAAPIDSRSYQEVVDNTIANPGSFGFVTLDVGEQFIANDPSPDNERVIYFGADPIACSDGWGFLLRKDDEDLCNCLDAAVELVQPWDYAELFCAGREEIFLENDGTLDETYYGQDFPQIWFEQGFMNGERNDDGPELPSINGVHFTFEDCGKYFCQRPGDEKCN